MADAQGADAGGGGVQLITEEYLAQQRELHAREPSYGTSGSRWRDKARELSEWGRLAILDYGAGRCTLAKALGPAYRVTNYDPAVAELSTKPSAHPIVVCGDVMEHIEPDLMYNVLADIRLLTMRTALFVINCGPARKVLSDGRNAHINIRTPARWAEALEASGFEIMEQGGNEWEAWYVCR